MAPASWPQYSIRLLAVMALWSPVATYASPQETPLQMGDRSVSSPSALSLSALSLIEVPRPDLASLPKAEADSTDRLRWKHLPTQGGSADSLGTVSTPNQAAVPVTILPDRLKQSTDSHTAISLTVDGRLEPGDSQLQDQSLYDTYLFEGEAGQVVAITLESLEFDPVLFLRTGQGEELARNNDIEAGNTHSFITVTLPTSGTYQVLVNALNSTGRGDYHLTVETVTSGQPTPRLSAAAMQFVTAGHLVRQGVEAASAAQQGEALSLLQQALAIYQAIGSQKGETVLLNAIASQYQTLGQYAEAITTYEQALSRARTIASAEDAMTALAGLGFIQQSQGDYPKAVSLYQQALTYAVENSLQYAVLLNAIGESYNLMGQYSLALESLQQGLNLYQSLNQPEGVALAQAQMGSVYLNTGDYSQALALYQQALPILRTAINRGDLATVLNLIGEVYRQTGDYPQALAYLQEGLELSREAGDRVREAQTLVNLGNVYNLQSQYPQALQAYEAGLEILQTTSDHYSTATTLNNMGLIYLDLADYRQALTYLEEGLALRREIGDRSGEGQSLANIGNAYGVQDQFETALTYYQQALAISQTLGDRHSASIILNNLGEVSRRLNRLDQALGYLQQGLEISQTIGSRSNEGLALSNLAKTQYDLGNVPLAIQALQQSLAIYQDIGEVGRMADVLNTLGKVLADQDQPELAIVFLKASVNALEGLRQNNRNLTAELQASFTESVSEAYRTLADLLLQQDRVLEAQRVLDLLKVQELNDYLRGIRGNANTSSGVDILRPEQAILARYGEVQQSAIALGNELADLRQIPESQRNAAQTERIAQLVDLQTAINREFNDFIDSPDITDLVAQLSRTAQRQNLNLEDLVTLQDKLADLNAAILYPLILDDRLELVVTTPTAPPLRRTVAVSRTDLNQAIVNLRSALTDPNSDAVTPARQLYDWLIRPLEADLRQAGVDTIIYAPDGQLRYIPLAALNDGNQWLIQRFRVNNITARSLQTLDTQPQQQLKVLAAAFANQDLNYQIQLGDNEVTFRGLPFAGQEVALLADEVPATTQFVDQNFSLAAVQPRMNEYNILHFATHAAFVPGSPDESFILFGNGDTPTLDDIKSWVLNQVDLVVLSACETGLGGQLGDGEEILGLGYQFQRAGARAVIASLWQVSDGGTQVLMNNFYAALETESSKAAALQQAQIDLITGNLFVNDASRRSIEVILADGATQGRGDMDLSHPYYWAPFILIGNGL